MRSLFEQARRWIGPLIGRESLPPPDVDIAGEHFGSAYGGWTVAIQNLNKDSIVYSFGVGEDASFDLALIQRFGLTVHAFDPTPKSIDWVKRQGFPSGFVMHEYGIADFDGEVSFNPPEDPSHVSHTVLDRPETAARSIRVPVKKLRTIAEELGHSRVDLLKMDIEGAEYAVIDDLARGSLRPTQLLVEFHHRFPGVGIGRTRSAIENIRSMGYKLFHVSPMAEDFCFIRSPSSRQS